MSDCPKCGTEIGRSSYCGCGWKRYAKSQHSDAEPHAACAYEGCAYDSFCKIKTPTGWANVCEEHYRIYHHVKAEKYCNDKGLDTREKRRAWITEFRRTRGLPVMRQPGEDSEEVAS